MKKFLSFSLVVILIIAFALNSFALSGRADGEKHSYTFSDGTTVSYYLDDSGNPYSYVNDERMYIALPLEHLKMQSIDFDVDNEGISPQFTIDNPIIFNREPPKNLFSLNGGDENKSNVYSANASFAGFNPFYSRDFELNTKHNAMKVKTTNINKPLFGSNKISFIYRFYDPTIKQWYRITIGDVNCTGISGFGFQHSPTEFPYGQIVILVPNDITSCTVNIWTTLAY